MHRAGFALRHELHEGLPGNARNLPARAKHPADHLRNLEARVAKPQDDRLGVFVQEGNGLAGLDGEPGVRGGEHVEVEHHDHGAVEGGADGLGELLHHAHEAGALRALGVGAGPPVDEDESRRVLRAAQALAHGEVQVEGELLVALDEHGHTAAQALLDEGDVGGAGGFDGVFDAEVDGQGGDGDETAHRACGLLEPHGIAHARGEITGRARPGC